MTNTIVDKEKIKKNNIEFIQSFLLSGPGLVGIGYYTLAESLIAGVQVYERENSPDIFLNSNSLIIDNMPVGLDLSAILQKHEISSFICQSIKQWNKNQLEEIFIRTALSEKEITQYLEENKINFREHLTLKDIRNLDKLEKSDLLKLLTMLNQDMINSMENWNGG